MTPPASASAGQWQPIETAPKDGTVVDLWVKESNGVAERWSDCCWDNRFNEHARKRSEMEFVDGWWSGSCPIGYSGETVSHWMPLPPPPAEGEGG
jgi:hypothetical protein